MNMEMGKNMKNLNYIMYYYNDIEEKIVEIAVNNLNYIMYYYNRGRNDTIFIKNSNLNYIMYYYNNVPASCWLILANFHIVCQI